MDAVDPDMLERPPDEDPLYIDMVVGPGRASDNRRFGALLADLREHAGLSRADAAATLGVSVEYLRLIELGRRTPALGQMRGVLDAYHAEGEVGRLQPGGDRPDLIVLDPLSDEPVVVEFRSRIREARRRALGAPPDLAHWQDDPDFQESVHESPSASRAAQLGFVVSLLARADDSTLQKVHDLLIAVPADGSR
jgi:transcriptional regulator with XRE-family HTH domain